MPSKALLGQMQQELLDTDILIESPLKPLNACFITWLLLSERDKAMAVLMIS